MRSESVGERSYSPTEAEIEEVRMQAKAAGGNPDKAEADFRAKFERAEGRVKAETHEETIASLENAIQKLTPEERKQIFDRYFKDIEN